MAKTKKKPEPLEREPHTRGSRDYIKVAGLIVAVAGLMAACFFRGYQIGRDKGPPRPRPALHPGIYEMQWAGENWLGVLKVEEDGLVKLLMNRVVKKEGRMIQDDPMFDAEGTIRLDGNGDFKLALLVKKHYEEAGETENFERLMATLKPYYSYAGPMDYYNKGSTTSDSGHFIMVNYRQVGVGRQPR